MTSKQMTKNKGKNVKNYYSVITGMLFIHPLQVGSVAFHDMSPRNCTTTFLFRQNLASVVLLCPEVDSGSVRPVRHRFLRCYLGHFCLVSGIW